MFKFASALVAVANAGRIPLIKNELSATDVEAQRLFYENNIATKSIAFIFL